jgi:hypothetical protein
MHKISGITACLQVEHISAFRCRSAEGMVTAHTGLKLVEEVAKPYWREFPN